MINKRTGVILYHSTVTKVLKEIKTNRFISFLKYSNLFGCSKVKFDEHLNLTNVNSILLVYTCNILEETTEHMSV
jgi:hypothetical protein